MLLGYYGVAARGVPPRDSRAPVPQTCIYDAIRKPLTRNAGQVESTPSLQQNAEQSAEGMTTRARSGHANRLAFNPFGNGQLRAFPIALAVAAQMMSGEKLSKESRYDVHSYTNRVHAPGRFRKTLTRHLPELSQPGTVPSRTAPRTDRTGRRRSEQLTMFRITAETCRGFTFAEVLIMAAMNIENARLASDVTSDPAFQSCGCRD